MAEAVEEGWEVTVGSRDKQVLKSARCVGAQKISAVLNPKP